MTTGAVQDALTAFHSRDFSPPVAHVALPTRGVLGEAILGHCASAEKIDLTRFWNWQDSPIPQATDIQSVSIGKGNALASAAAPSTLGSIAPIINNIVPTGGSVGTGASDGTDLAKALVAGQQLSDMTNITGQQQLADLIKQTQTSADNGRSNAMNNANTLVTTAMTEMSKIVQTGIQAFADIETGGAASAGKKAGGGNGSSNGGGKGGKGGKGSGGSGSGGGGNGNG